MLESLPNTVGYRLVTQDRAKWETRFADRKDTTKDITDFRTRAAKVTSAEDMLKDYKLMKFTLTAYGLESELGKTAVLRKLLTEDPASDKSFANRMVDPRYKQFAQDMAKWDPPAIQQPDVQAKMEKNYITNAFEASEGANGLRASLYFKRKAEGVTSVANIIGDKVMMEVMRGALNLGDKFSMLDYDQQKRILTKRVNIEDFQDPKKVDQMAQRYLLAHGQSEPTSTVATILSGGNGVNSIIGLGMTLRLSV